MGSGYGGGNVNGVNWGDGSQLLIASAGPNCGASPGPLEPLPTPEPGSHESTYRHVYFTSGSHTITVIAGWPNFCGDNRLRGGGRATLPVTVTAAAIPGNGPNDPVPTVGITPFARTNSLTGDVAATDPDGYVRTLVVNFGDGSAPRTFHNTAGCQAPRPAWHDSQYRVNWSRTFAPGRHTITLRATSTDCSGGSSQVITLERTIDVTTHGFHDVGTLHYRPHEPYYAHIDDTLPA
jgi:hypothetical protein